MVSVLLTAVVRGGSVADTVVEVDCVSREVVACVEDTASPLLGVPVTEEGSELPV